MMADVLSDISLLNAWTNSFLMSSSVIVGVQHLSPWPYFRLQRHTTLR